MYYGCWAGVGLLLELILLECGAVLGLLVESSWCVVSPGLKLRAVGVYCHWAPSEEQLVCGVIGLLVESSWYVVSSGS